MDECEDKTDSQPHPILVFRLLFRTHLDHCVFSGAVVATLCTDSSLVIRILSVNV